VSNRIQDPSVRTQEKRRRGIIELGTRACQELAVVLNDDDDDGDDDVPLPENPTILQEEVGTQRRTSGRVPKRLRRDDEEFVYS
jgi:hypothetical protein